MRLLAVLFAGMYACSIGFAVGVTSCSHPKKKVIIKLAKVEGKNDSLPVGGYLTNISTPSYTNDLTQKILIDFNQLGSGDAVLWVNSVHPFGPLLNRQITIKETKECKFEKNGKIKTCVGIAHCGKVSCDIEVVTGMTTQEYRQVLLHEYMHCMGFDDNSDPKDLMYHTENVAPEINIRMYAELAAQRQETWKNLKNLSSSIKPTK